MGYLNTSPRRHARYRQFHFNQVRSPRDEELAKAWIDAFVRSDSFFRVIAVDWDTWDGRYFGDPFEAAALKKRRAYKKWCELLFQPELSSPPAGGEIRNARLFLDQLRIAYDFDVIDHLKERFAPPDHYRGRQPYIQEFMHAQSWRDANQCLQLTDLLLGCVHQGFMPSQKPGKEAIMKHAIAALAAERVTRLDPGFWKQFHHSTLRTRMPKFSVWCWTPERKRR